MFQKSLVFYVTITREALCTVCLLVIYTQFYWIIWHVCWNSTAVGLGSAVAASSRSAQQQGEKDVCLLQQDRGANPWWRAAPGAVTRKAVTEHCILSQGSLLFTVSLRNGSTCFRSRIIWCRLERRIDSYLKFFWGKNVWQWEKLQLSKSIFAKGFISW